jgi:hypothetical protein
MQYADLVLSGVAPVKQSVYTILLHIAERLIHHEHGLPVRQAIEVWHVATEDTLP